MAALTTLFRPVGAAELALIAQSGWRAFPPRLPDQPIFYPVLNEGYAIQIARDWNATKPGAYGFVTRFDVDAQYCAGFERQVVGGREHEELWVPAEELATFNTKIAAPILVTRIYRGGSGMADELPVPDLIDDALIAQWNGSASLV